MPRAAVRDTQAPTEQREQRTGPRVSSGFQPAQRSISPQRFSNAPREMSREEEDAEVSNNLQQPTTKSGYPDRRFRGQRDLPPPPEVEQAGARARTGGTIGDVHVTIDGKPDRRFKENRQLSDEELTRQWLENMNRQFGQKR